MIEFELIDDSQTIDANLIDDTEKIEVGLIKEIDKYSDLKELPSINDVTLIGNKTLHDLGIQLEGDYATNTELQEGLATKVDKETGKGLSTNDYTNEEKQKLSTLENYDDTEVRELIDTKQPRGNYLTEETDPTVPTHVKSITQNDITNWNNKADESDIPDVSSFITKDVNNLTNYTLKTNTGSLIDLEIDTTDYIVTLSLKNQDGTVISTDSIDLPLESVVVSGRYDNNTKKVILTLENGSEVDFSVADLVSGLQTELSSSNKLNADYVDDTNSGNKFVTTSEKTTWNNKLDSSALTNYVTNTDYATSQKGGVIKINDFYGVEDSTDGGTLRGRIFSYADYQQKNNFIIMSKGTLENVITGKGLATKNDIPKYYHGTCATGASTRLKVVECEGFVLEEGATISVTFTNAQTYNGSPQLNVNGTGAIIVQSRSGVNGVRYMWSAGEIIDFTYDGTYWVCHGRGFATTSYYGVTKLSTSASSDSQTYALTPRSLYYFANYSICPYYSASKTYAVGDKVRYTYYIYECTTEIDTPESWNAEHWQIVDPLQVQINALEARIKALENS